MIRPAPRKFYNGYKPVRHFIATFIAPLDENRLKPNMGAGSSPFTTPIDFWICYENCENISGCANL